MAAAQHQGEIVGQGQFELRQGLDDGHLGIVDQYHDMRQFDGRLLPHPDAGGQAVEDRPLGGADERGGTGPIVVGFEIERNHQPRARRARLRPPFDQHEPRRLGFENPLGEIAFHGPVDGGDARGTVCLVEIDLGEDQVEGRGMPLGQTLDFMPVFGLRGILVAGDHRPAGRIEIGSGEQKGRHLKGKGGKGHRRHP